MPPRAVLQPTPRVLLSQGPPQPELRLWTRRLMLPQPPLLAVVVAVAMAVAEVKACSCCRALRAFPSSCALPLARRRRSRARRRRRARSTHRLSQPCHRRHLCHRRHVCHNRHICHRRHSRSSTCDTRARWQRAASPRAYRCTCAGCRSPCWSPTRRAWLDSASSPFKPQLWPYPPPPLHPPPLPHPPPPPPPPPPLRAGPFPSVEARAPWRMAREARVRSRLRMRLAVQRSGGRWRWL
jgi:hypothetical protein